MSSRAPAYRFFAFLATEEILSEADLAAIRADELALPDLRRSLKAEVLIRQLVVLGRTDFLGDMAREYPNPRVRARIGQLLEGNA